MPPKTGLPGAGPRGTGLRVVSANLWNGRVDPSWLRELVNALRADAVALQECEPRHWSALQDLLPHGVFHAGRRATSMGFAARYPVETRFVELAWRPAPWLRLAPEDWPGLSSAVDLLGVHIAAPHTYTPPGYGFWLRRLQLRQLEAHFGPGGAASCDGVRTVMIGDFNATERWPVYRRLAGCATDAAVAAAQRQGRAPEPTWGPLFRGRRLLRIDHAWTRGVEARQAHVVALEGSDHSALVVDLDV